MKNKKEFYDTLKEMLELSGVLNEAREDEGEEEIEKSSSGEIKDVWEVEINRSGVVKLEFHETYVYMWFNGKKSSKMEIPLKLRPYKKDVIKFFKKLMSWIEGVS